MPPAEVLLWKEFKTWRNQGIVIRRQHAINQYIVDFAHIKSKTIIEVDGKSHDGERAGYDSQRQLLLESYGWKFVRVSDRDVTQNPIQVAESIFELLCKNREA